MPHIDRYEHAWSKLEQFNSRFPEDMKKSLLQYAIQGKLVEQRPEEGTAEELFAQIQEEKQRLIAEKKIKKKSPCPKSLRRKSRSIFQKVGNGFICWISLKKSHQMAILQKVLLILPKLKILL